MINRLFLTRVLYWCGFSWTSATHPLDIIHFNFQFVLTGLCSFSCLCSMTAHCQVSCVHSGVHGCAPCKHEQPLQLRVFLLLSSPSVYHVFSSCNFFQLKCHMCSFRMLYSLCSWTRPLVFCSVWHGGFLTGSTPLILLRQSFQTSMLAWLSL